MNNTILNLQSLLSSMQDSINNEIIPVIGDMSHNSSLFDSIVNLQSNISTTLSELLLSVQNGNFKGDKGDSGDKGDKGDFGAKGDNGAKGDKGDIGLGGLPFPSKIVSNSVYWCDDVSYSSSYTLNANAVLSTIDITKDFLIKGFSFISSGVTLVGSCYVAIFPMDAVGTPLPAIAVSPLTVLDGIGKYIRVDILLPSAVFIPSGTYYLSIVSNGSGSIFGCQGLSTVKKLGENSITKIRFYNSGVAYPICYRTFSLLNSVTISASSGTSPAIGLITQ